MRLKTFFFSENTCRGEALCPSSAGKCPIVFSRCGQNSDIPHASAHPLKQKLHIKVTFVKEIKKARPSKRMFSF
jgi:hypothetical protein